MKKDLGLQGDADISELSSNIIVLTGPESCGKTTLASGLGEMLGAHVVPEISRAYLNQRITRDSQFHYSEPDLLEIAGEQHRLEQLALGKNPDMLLCDTDLLVLIIWSEVRFGVCHQWILDTFAANIEIHKRHYLLCHYDVPWEADPLRENPDDREELFALYQDKLDFYGIDYSIISGTVEARINQAMTIIEKKITRH